MQLYQAFYDGKSQPRPPMLAALAMRAGKMAPDGTLARIAAATVLACLPLTAFAWYAPTLLSTLLGSWFEALGPWRYAAELASVGALGCVVYGVMLLAALRLMGVRLPGRRSAALPPAEELTEDTVFADP